MCMYPTTQPMQVPTKTTAQLAAERNAVDVPLGDGLAQRARLAIKSRQKNIDDAVDAASH